MMEGRGRARETTGDILKKSEPAVCYIRRGLPGTAATIGRCFGQKPLFLSSPVHLYWGNWTTRAWAQLCPDPPGKHGVGRREREEVAAGQEIRWLLVEERGGAAERRGAVDIGSCVWKVSP